jgi:hypothetical protein
MDDSTKARKQGGRFRLAEPQADEAKRETRGVLPSRQWVGRLLHIETSRCPSLALGIPG